MNLLKCHLISIIFAAAKTYLTHTNLSVGDIANTLHYADQQYFSSSFKKAMGFSPLEYRRKTRKD